MELPSVQGARRATEPAAEQGAKRETSEGPETETRARPQAGGAREIKALASFFKAVKAVGLYPEGSPVPEKLAGAFAADLAPCFETSERVQITFRGDGVQLNGTAAPPSGDDVRDLPATLFEVGLRDLTFLPGVSPAELATLVRLLSRAARRELNPAEEDISVLLWEMDLPGVTYRVVDVGDEAEWASAAEEVDSPGEDAAVRELWEDLHPLERYLRESDAQRAVSPDDAAAIATPEQVEEMLRRAKREPAAMGRKFILVLLELAVHNLPADEFARIRTLLPGFFRQLLLHGQFQAYIRLAARLLERVRQTESAAGRTLDGLGLEILDAQAAESALSALRSGHCDDADAALALLCSLDAGGLAALLEEAVDGIRGPGRAELRLLPGRAVSHVVAARPEALFARPESLSAAHLRHLETLIRPGGDDAQRWCKLLADFLGSADAELRERALAILVRVHPPDLAQTLTAALQDTDPRVRHLAVARLSELYPEQAFAQLRAVIAREEFSQRDFEEQAAVYEGMTRAAPGEAFPLLEQILRRREWMAPKTWRVEKACALRGLGEAPYEKAMPLLNRYRKAHDPQIAEACRVALARQHRHAREAGAGADPVREPIAAAPAA